MGARLDRRSLSWAFRATDSDNYYATKLVITKPGPLPNAGLVRYAMVNGRAAVPAVVASFGRFEMIPKLPALRAVEIPPVAGLGSFIRDRKAAGR